MNPAIANTWRDDASVIRDVLPRGLVASIRFTPCKRDSAVDTATVTFSDFALQPVGNVPSDHNRRAHADRHISADAEGTRITPNSLAENAGGTPACRAQGSLPGCVPAVDPPESLQGYPRGAAWGC